MKTATHFDPEWLRVRLAVLNMSARELVTALRKEGIEASQSSVYRWMRGDRGPGARQIQAMRKVLR